MISDGRIVTDSIRAASSCSRTTISGLLNRRFGRRGTQKNASAASSKLRKAGVSTAKSCSCSPMLAGAEGRIVHTSPGQTSCS
jgi:hypothetical protein